MRLRFPIFVVVVRRLVYGMQKFALLFENILFESWDPLSRHLSVKYLNVMYDGIFSAYKS